MAPRGLLDSDPIESSPFKGNDRSSSRVNDGSSDNEADALFDGIDNHKAHKVAMNPPHNDGHRISHMIPDDIVSSPPQGDRFVTQPTQIVTTPPRPNGRIQVPRTSPTPDTQRESPLPIRPQHRPIASIIAPPGTRFNPPPVRSSQSQFNDTPIDVSDDEDELAKPSNSDIKRTKFTVAGMMASQRDELANSEPRVSSFNGSLNGYTHSEASRNPSKRPAVDDMASAYGNVTRPSKLMRQTGPARAMPVDEPMPDMTISQIRDLNIRENVRRIQEVLPNAKIRDCEHALFTYKGNLQDAMAAVSDLVERQAQIEKSARQNTVDLTQDETMTRPKGVAHATQKPLLQTRTKPQYKSIAERYAATHTTAQRPSQTQREAPNVSQQPRRRLVQGRKKREPSTSPMPEVVAIDDDNDSAVSISSDDADGDTYDTHLLDIINTFSTEELTDLSEQPLAVVSLIIENRPYKNLDAVRSFKVPGKGRARARNVGERFVETCENALTAFKAIDRLAEKCRKAGEPVDAIMERWGFSNRDRGELELTNFEESKSERNSSEERDSGIGTPSTSSKTGKFKTAKDRAEKIGKPAMMSEDITLKDYQIVGLNWLALLYQHGLSCILGDDMGLGKTCQVIAFLSHLFEKGVKGPHLIVVQSSTIENWLREFDTFSPQLEVMPYHGSQAERHQIQRTIRARLEDADDELYAVVTTYKMTEQEDDRIFLKRLRPNVIVYDEAQMLKNATSARYKALMRLQANFRLLLTGTPVQNNLQELTALLGFLMPEAFSEHQDALSYIFKHRAKTTETDHTALLSDRRIQRAREMMKPFILRRKKHQVLKHLPTKTFTIEKCEMTKTQKEVYDQILHSSKDTSEIEADQVEKLAEQSEEGGNVNEGKVLMQLRQAAAHTLLLQNGLYSENDITKMSHAAANSGEFGRTKQDKLFFNWRDKFCDGSLMKLCYENNSLNKWMRPIPEAMDSGKVIKLLELLKQHAANGDRTLVFSQWTSMLDILEIVLNENDINYCRLDGSTSVQDRQMLIDEYNGVRGGVNVGIPADLSVFMLSTKAGGTGVNLATANKVIIFDSGYNPQEDVQAGNRAHRVGQTRPVEVVTLVTKDTIEEKIWALGESKLKLDAQIAGEVAAAVAATAKPQQPAAREDGEVKTESSSTTKESKDIKDVFMDGLKNAGLNMSAAAEATKPATKPKARH